MKLTLSSIRQHLPTALVLFFSFWFVYSCLPNVSLADYNPTGGTPGAYPEGTLKINGQNTQEITVKKGDKVSYTVNITNASKVCFVYVYKIKANASTPIDNNNPRDTFEVNRGQSTITRTGTFDTSALPDGKYRLFIYAQTDCQGDPYGNEDNGFDCDANPTCKVYCGGAGGTRNSGDTSTGVYEPGDLYRTSSNPAYLGGGAGSCGEKKGQNDNDGIANAPRTGECELKACDPTGKNLDIVTINVGGSASTGGSTPTTPGTGSGTGTGTGSGGGTTTSPASPTNVTLPATTGTPGQVTSAQAAVKVPTGAALDVSAGLTTVSNTTPYTGGDLSNQSLQNVDLTSKAKIAVAKAVKLNTTANSPITLTNPSTTNVTVSIPNNTTVLAADNWNGQISSPTKLTGSMGAAAQGFQVGSGFNFSVGSNSQSLLFDNLVTLTITLDSALDGGVAYKSPETTELVNVPLCSGGTFASPTAPEFPKECYFTDETKKTVKILTYHFSEYVNLKAASPAAYTMAGPGVCLDPSDTSKILMNVKWMANQAYEKFAVARQACSSYNVCSGPEVSLTDGFIPNQDSLMSTPDLGTQNGKYYRYRIWGLLRGTQPPIGDLSTWDARYWSSPVTVQANCNGTSKGLSITDFQINVATPVPNTQH